MSNLPLTMPHHHLSLPLAERVAGGGFIWLVARLVLGGLFVMGGTGKLTGLDQFAGMLVKNGIPETIAPTLAAIGAISETAGGLLIMLGLATNWAALLLIAFTIIATLIAHRFWEFQGDGRMNQMNHFTKNVMIVCGFLFLYVAGGGPYSIDRWWRERSG
jgi:putative oxidoreductase